VSSIPELRSRPPERKIELLDQVDYRLAETEEERDEIYRLRYRAYFNEGAIEPNRERKVSDRFDDLPNSWIFGVYFDGVLSSSLRISVASPEWPDTPSMSVFPEILGPELAKGKVMVDPTRFVADPARAKRIPELPYMTLRLAYVACEYFRADMGLASVRTEHQAFYKRVFLHTISPARAYPTLTKPICLMAIDFPAMREKVFAGTRSCVRAISSAACCSNATATACPRWSTCRRSRSNALPSCCPSRARRDGRPRLQPGLASVWRNQIQSHTKPESCLVPTLVIVRAARSCEPRNRNTSLGSFPDLPVPAAATIIARPS